MQHGSREDRGRRGRDKSSRGVSCERSEGGCRKSLERGRYVHRRTDGTLLHSYRGRPTESHSPAADESGFARKGRRPCSTVLLVLFFFGWRGRNRDSSGGTMSLRSEEHNSGLFS